MPCVDCSLLRIGLSYLAFKFKALNQDDQSRRGLALHRLLAIQVPFHYKLTVAVNVDVARRMVTLPTDENVAAPANLSHS